jgi:hypothetical protein
MRAFATVRAFERKADLGGGFRGIVAFADGEPFQSEVMPTIEAAWAAAHRALVARLDGRGFTWGHYRSDRYRKNAFVG